MNRRHPAAPPRYPVCYDPTTMIVAGAALAAVSSVSQGLQAKEAGDVQAKFARQQADVDERDFRRSQSALLAARRAALGASGVEPGAGSPLIVSEDFAAETELQAQRIRTSGENRARQTQFAGRRARHRGFLRGGASLLSGLGAVDFGGSAATAGSSSTGLGPQFTGSDIRAQGSF